MAKAQFIHLHNHTEYSLFDGLLRFRDNDGKPSAFMLELAEQKGAAMAITDHGNMYGAMDFYFTARELGVKPIIGCEFYVQRTPVSDKSEGSHKGAGHLTLLAADPEGYSNLCRLVSKSYIDGFNHGPKVDLDLLAKHSKSVICLSGCIAGFVTRACSLGNMDEALAQAAKHAAIFGKGNFYLELMDNGLPEQAAAMKGLLELAKKLKLPVVATNDCHYWKKQDWEVQDAKLCLGTKSFIADQDRFRFTGREYYFKSPEEMAKLFSHTPEAVKSTLEIAERCKVELPEGEPRLPEYGKGNADAQLKALAVKGLAARLSRPGADHKKRLELELKSVKDAGVASYFLILADVAKHLRAEDETVGPGRGPSTGSLLNYALGITGIDPLPAGLFFERFFNPDRQMMPDLAMDMGAGARAKALERLRKRISPEAVTGVAVLNRYKARNLIWSLGAALQADKQETAALQKLIPFDFGTSSGLARLQGVKELCLSPRMKKLVELTDELCGLVTNTGFHSAGVLLAPGDASELIPLSTSPKREVMTQYDGRALSRLGFMKVDLLTLSALDAEKGAAARIKTRGFDLEKLPLDDVKTWTLIAHGLTTGVFQLEAEGIKKLLVQAQPARLEDLAALIALFRPGPMHSGMTDTFITRKLKKDPAYPHPLLEPVLKDTYGLFIYQEQAMAAARDLAGFSPREADQFRRTLSRKEQPGMDEARKNFIAGAKKKKIAAREADKLFALIGMTAGYGYNKSHALSYALLAYRSAYLKANHPQEYMTALLDVEKAAGPDRASRFNEYLAEARRIGVKI